MAITTAYYTWYDKTFSHLSLPALLANDIKIALLSSGYTPNFTTHEYYDVHITNELTTANGYTAGGQSLTTKSLNDVGGGEVRFLSDSPTWVATGGNLVARSFVAYDNTPSSNKPLIGFGYLNYNGGTPADVSVYSTYNLIVSVPATGWFRTEKVNGI